MRASIGLFVLASLVIWNAKAFAGDQCLTDAEVTQAARMSAIMAVGSEIRHCGSCLADRYPQTVRNYENGLLSDFFGAKDTFKGQEKIDYADTLVRTAARKSALSFSTECDACSKLADTVDRTSAPENRQQFYADENAGFIRNSGAKVCP